MLFLHGNIDHPPLTITRDDCQRTRETLKANDFKLETLLAIHTLVVIGSGFPDAHLNDLYLVASRIVGHNSRLRVALSTKEAASRFRASNPELAKGSVQVTYPAHPDFRDTLCDVVSHCDPSAKVETIPFIEPREDRLYEIVAAQPYSFRSTSNLRQRYQESPHVARLLDLSAEYLLDRVAIVDRVTAGLFATLLSVAGDPWRPGQPLLDELEKLCNRILQDSDWSSIGVVEPLAFALGRKGRRAPQTKYLNAVVFDDEWRRADISRTGQYYEDLGSQIDAMKRHVRDERRDGLLLANDVARLINLLSIAGPAKRVITALLDKCIKALYEGGQETLAEMVQREALDILRAGGERDIEYFNVVS